MSPDDLICLRHMAARARAPQIEWTVIIGMRNRLVHAYFDVDTGILWETATRSVPALLAQLLAIEGLGESDTP